MKRPNNPSEVLSVANHAVKQVLCSLCLLCGLNLVGAAETLTPPPVPSVPPLVAKNYSSDANSDRIDDALFDKAKQADAAVSSAGTAQQRNQAQAALNQMVEVELVFDEQIKQQQIDAFTGHGGQISYIYKAVSYGWNGKIPLGKVRALPAAMGASLVLIEEAKPMKMHMETATRTGRVRPVWATGFAGNVAGFDGNTNITIAVVDTGIDESHADLTGRRVYWRDFSADAATNAIDFVQHGSHVAGIAMGTGISLTNGGTLSVSSEGDMDGLPAGSFYLSPLELPGPSVTVTMTAQWDDSNPTTLSLAYHTKGTSGGYTAQSQVSGTSPLTLTTTFAPAANRMYTPALESNGTMTNYSLNLQISNYPAIGDGFNRLRGVAPECKWAGAKVFTASGGASSTTINAAVDDLVANRVSKNIKVMNLSLGYGNGGTDPTQRQKINNAVNNGIVVCISAGNDGNYSTAADRKISDPGRAALALTVAASDDNNQVTDYSSEGFSSPSSTAGQEEDYKPDLMAPGGSARYYSSILSVDSNSGDGAFADQQTNDYYNIQGTSMASPFAAGCAALVIDALQQKGTNWDFSSSKHSRLVKMLLCATASESNTNRDSGVNNPSLQRATNGPSSFPVGKDQYEGYGMINPDAAVEAVTLIHTNGTTETNTLGPTVTDRRVWARKISLPAGQATILTLTNPPTGDFDFYLYSMTPGTYGGPTILASSTQVGSSVNETFMYLPATNTTAILVVKRISGSGLFKVNSAPIPPPAAPSNLTATAISYSQIDLTWRDNSTNETAFIVSQGKASAGPYTNIATVSANVTNYSSTNLTGSTTYYYMVRATNSSGASANSAVASATTLVTPPMYPLNTIATTGGTIVKDPDQSGYFYDTVVAVTAVPDAGYVFVGWTGDLEGAENPTTITINGSKTVTAHFVAETDIIIDNPQASYFGLWTLGTASPDKYGNSYAYALTTSGPADAEAYFTPTLLHSGKYNIFISSPGGSTRSTNAQLTLGHDGTETVSSLNQTPANSTQTWQSIAHLIDLTPNSEAFVKLSNNSGETNKLVIADAVRFTLIVPPTIISQPQDVSTVVGAAITIRVMASGTALSYQWRYNGINIGNGTSSTFTIPSARLSDSGGYSVRIANDAGAVVSATATVTVTSAQPLTMSGLALDGQRQFSFQVSGDPANYVIEGSSNLVSWIPLTNITISSGPVPFIDTTSTNLEKRFYRTRMTP